MNNISVPCKVGQKLWVIAYCNEISMDRDDGPNGTGAVECPYEADCVHEDCDTVSLNVFETECTGLNFTDPDMSKFDIYVKNFFNPFTSDDWGKYVFMTEFSARSTLKEMK